MTLLVSTLITCMIMALFSLGVYISFRYLNFPDLTAEGTFAFSGAIVALLLNNGISPWSATLLAMVCGGVGGIITAILWTKTKISPLLAGLIVMSVLFLSSIELMRQKSIQMYNVRTICTGISDLFGKHNALGREVGRIENADMLFLFFLTIVVIFCGLMLWLSSKSVWGMILRSFYRNKEAMNGIGERIDRFAISGLAVAGMLTGLAGALLAQYHGVAELQNAYGLLLGAIAGILFGEMIYRDRSPGGRIFGVIIGTIVLRLFLTVFCHVSLNCCDVKLLAIVVLLLMIIAPPIYRRVMSRNITGDKNAGTD